MKDPIFETLRIDRNYHKARADDAEATVKDLREIVKRLETNRHPDTCDHTGGNADRCILGGCPYCGGNISRIVNAKLKKKD